MVNCDEIIALIEKRRDEYRDAQLADGPGETDPAIIDSAQRAYDFAEEYDRLLQAIKALLKPEPETQEYRDAFLIGCNAGQWWPVEPPDLGEELKSGRKLSDDFQDGYIRGFVVGFATRREKERQPVDPEWEELRAESTRLESIYIHQGRTYTDGQWAEWKALQKRIRERAERKR